MSRQNEYKPAMGRRIQKARKAARMTQMKFAEKIDVSTQYVSDLERGIVGCSVATLLKICDVLEVSADFLLMGQKADSPNFPTLAKEFSDLSPKEQKLVEEGFALLKKAFSLKHTEPKKDV